MKVLLVFFLLMIINFLKAEAQRDFREGFIITLGNDTVPGKILNKESEKRFDECTFRKLDDSEPVIYNPFQILGYSITQGRSYLAKDVTTGQNVGKIFLEVYALGKANLLFANDRYFLDKDGTLNELVESKSTVVLSDRQLVRTDKRYLRVLEARLTDCPGISGSIKNSLLTGPSLIRLIEKYNNCFQTTVVSKKVSKKWFQLMAGLSAGHSMVKRDGFEETVLFDGWVIPDKFGKDDSFYPGLSLEISSPATTENIAFHMDFFYQKNTLSSDLNSFHSTWNFESINIQMSFSYYFLNLQKTKLFLEFGGSFYRRNDSRFNVNTRSVLLSSRTNTLLLFGTGVAYSPISSLSLMLKIRYERGENYVTDRDVIRVFNFNQTFSVLYKF